MQKKVGTYIAKWDMLKKEDKIIVGVSGGADSICLLFVLLELQKSIPFEIVVVHVNHGLRGAEADADEQYVREICKEHDIPCLIYSEDVGSIAKIRKQSTEEAGREVRREAFHKAMESCKGTKIALAHHKNDSVETFFMNLARGSGLKGLGGIKPVSGEYIRPLLCLERREIEEYLKKRQIRYCEDATNEGDEYTRNRIRNHVIPYLEREINAKAVSHISETMRQLQQVQEYLEEQTELYYARCVKEQEDYLICKEKLAEAPSVIQPLILKRVLTRLSGREKDIEEIHVKCIQQLLDKQVGRRVDLPYEMVAKRIYEGILVCRKEDTAATGVSFTPDFTDGARQEFSWNVTSIVCELVHRDEKIPAATYVQKSGVRYFDYDIITKSVCVRTRKAGDYITINADGNTQKLKAFFVNEKIPQEKRDDVLVVADGNHILWIVGYRTNMKYHVTEKTRRILKISINKGENYGRDD